MHDLQQEDPFEGPDKEIAQICADLQSNDIDITIRAVALRLHVSHTTVSRNRIRRAQVERCAELQRQARRIASVNQKRRKNNSELEIARLKDKIMRLEQRVDALTASHKAMILAVGEIGGIEGWKRFYQHYPSAALNLPRPDNLSSL